MNYLKNNTSTLKTSNHIFPLCAIRGGFKASAGSHCAYWVSKLPHMKLFSAAVPPSARTHVLGRAAGSCRLCARTGRFGLWLRAWHTCSCENSSKSKDEKPTTTTTSWPIGWVGGWWLNGGGKKYYKTDKNKNACMCAARALACSFVCLCARSCGYHTQREKRICILFFSFFSPPPLVLVLAVVVVVGGGGGCGLLALSFRKNRLVYKKVASAVVASWRTRGVEGWLAAATARENSFPTRVFQSVSEWIVRCVFCPLWSFSCKFDWRTIFHFFVRVIVPFVGVIYGSSFAYMPWSFGSICVHNFVDPFSWSPLHRRCCGVSYTQYCK